MPGAEMDLNVKAFCRPSRGFRWLGVREPRTGVLGYCLSPLTGLRSGAGMSFISHR